MFDQIKKNQGTALSRMLSGFERTPVENDLSKAISEEEFSDRYSVGYNVFNEDAIDTFRGDALEKGEDEELVTQEILKLEEVLIQKGEETMSLYVSKIVSTEEDA